jgi:hypothetical protein
MGLALWAIDWMNLTAQLRAITSPPIPFNHQGLQLLNNLVTLLRKQASKKQESESRVLSRVRRGFQGKLST